MWNIKDIFEADYGCEERLPGEPLMVLVIVENEYGQEMRFEVADSYLEIHELQEGDEWPEEIDESGESDEKYHRQNQWMDDYMDAMEEALEENVESE